MLKIDASTNTVEVDSKLDILKAKCNYLGNTNKYKRVLLRLLPLKELKVNDVRYNNSALHKQVRNSKPPNSLQKNERRNMILRKMEENKIEGDIKRLIYRKSQPIKANKEVRGTVIIKNFINGLHKSKSMTATGLYNSEKSAEDLNKSVLNSRSKFCILEKPYEGLLVKRRNKSWYNLNNKVNIERNSRLFKPHQALFSKHSFKNSLEISTIQKFNKNFIKRRLVIN